MSRWLRQVHDIIGDTFVYSPRFVDIAHREPVCVRKCRDLYEKYGAQSTFMKVAPQTFFLRNTQAVAEVDAAEPKRAQISSSDRMQQRRKSSDCLSFLDAAKQVLDQFGHRNSMHYREITDKAINEGWLMNTMGKTPEATP